MATYNNNNRCFQGVYSLEQHTKQIDFYPNIKSLQDRARDDGATVILSSSGTSGNLFPAITIYDISYYPSELISISGFFDSVDNNGDLSFVRIIYDNNLIVNDSSIIFIEDFSAFNRTVTSDNNIIEISFNTTEKILDFSQNFSLSSASTVGSIYTISYQLYDTCNNSTSLVKQIIISSIPVVSNQPDVITVSNQIIDTTYYIPNLLRNTNTYYPKIDNERRDYIKIYTDHSNNSSKLRISCKVPNRIKRTPNSSKSLYNFTQLMIPAAKSYFKNKIILSADFSLNNNKNVCLITQKNLNHNIKYIHLNNDFSKPRLLFTKYSDNVNPKLNNDNYYFQESDISYIFLNDISFRIFTNEENYVGNNKDSFINIHYFYNIYKNYNNSDYYRFNFQDFTFNQVKTNTSVNNIKITDISLHNNFSNQLQNYDPLNFNTLFYYNDFTDSSYNNLIDISYVNLTNKNNIIDLSNTFLLYNKFDNITKIKIDNLTINSIGVDICDIDALEIDTNKGNYINFALLKRNYLYTDKNKLYQDNPNTGKILIKNDEIYLNCNVINYSNNFYNVDLNPDFSNSLNNNMLYLSLGNGITGITQNNLSVFKLNIKKTVINSTAEKTNIPVQRNIYTFDNIYIDNSSNLLNNLNGKYYLIDNSYNYNYTSILYNIYNESSIKYFSINFDDELKFLNNSNSPYINNLRNFEILNKDVSFGYYNNNSNYNNLLNRYILSNISYNTNNTLKINNKIINNIITNELINDLSENSIEYNFTRNYNKTVVSSAYITLKYIFNNLNNTISSQFLNFLQNYNNNLVMNFHKILIYSEKTSGDTDNFSNVNCILIYNNPETTTNPDYKYPNNNLQIIRDSEIDSFNNIIENLPNAASGNTNSVIIPFTNGNNLSRKQIFGKIALNDITGLLSITPRDPKFTDGRGFINQFQINDNCKTDNERINDKINIYNKTSNINPNTNSNANNTNKINYANIVRNNRINKLSQVCRQSQTNNVINVTRNNVNVPSNINKYYTPFTNKLWKFTNKR